MNVTENSANVVFDYNDTKFDGTIDWYQLSDFQQPSKMLFCLLTNGMTFSAKVFSVTAKGVVKLTRKELFMHINFSNALPKDQKQNLVFGIVQSIGAESVCVEAPNDKTYKIKVNFLPPLNSL